MPWWGLGGLRSAYGSAFKPSMAKEDPLSGLYVKPCSFRGVRITVSPADFDSAGGGSIPPRRAKFTRRKL